MTYSNNKTLLSLRTLVPVLAFAGAVSLALQNVQAQTLIDNFQGYDTGPVNDATGGVWTAMGDEGFSLIESDNGGNYISYGGGGNFRGAYRDLGAQSLANGSTGTYFKQFRANVTDPDHSFGLSDNSEPGWFSEFKPQAVLQGQSGNDLVQLGMRSGTVENVLTDLELGVWYNIWMVIDNDANSLDVYFSEGLNDGALAGSGFGFRDNQAAGDLNTFLLFGGGGGLGVSIDNIYFAEGVNVVNPIPEPSTYAAIFGALAFLGVLYFRRRRNS